MSKLICEMRGPAFYTPGLQSSLLLSSLPCSGRALHRQSPNKLLLNRDFEWAIQPIRAVSGHHSLPFKERTIRMIFSMRPAPSPCNPTPISRFSPEVPSHIPNQIPHRRNKEAVRPPNDWHQFSRLTPRKTRNGSAFGDRFGLY
jgi:hypothetical protein